MKNYCCKISQITNHSTKKNPSNSCTIRLLLIRNQLDIVIELKSSLRVILARDKVDNQRILDGKH